LSDKKLNRKL